MRLNDLDIQESAKEIIKSWGICELYPPQAECMEDVLSGESSVLAFPTASGKSLLAYLAVIKRVLEEGGKALYIVPLRALASEKVEDLRQFEKLGLSVSVSMGDYDAPDPRLKENDIIVATSEKADSLLRHNVSWLDEINLVIADEVHLIGDRDRGATLEVTLTKLKEVNPSAQIIALSATISNSDAIAEWLDAAHHKSDWRPVDLRTGILHDGVIWFEDGEEEQIEGGEGVEATCLPIIKSGDQCLVFVSTRRSTEATADKIASKIAPHLDEELKNELEELSNVIRDVSTTSLGLKLANMVESGAAFHNAGLNNKQRKLVERGFRERKIKLIVATPTLAAGINLPARRVVIRDLRRYDPLFGNMNWLPIMEVKQMCGRAGRPGYDDIGEAVLLCKRESQYDLIRDQYIFGESRPITSRMAVETSLRKHLLALIATLHCQTMDEIQSFMEGTYHAHYGEPWMIESKITEVLDMLKEEGLIINEGDLLKSTKFGRMVSDLYIDPLSAIKLRKAVESGKKGLPISYLHTICMTPDVYLLYIRKKEIGEYEEVLDHIRADLFEDLPADPGGIEEYYSALKTACMLRDWMEEIPEDIIAKRYDIGPGDIRNRVETAEWLMHATSRLASIYNPMKSKELKTLTQRIKYGIKDELLPLMELEYVGRVRARKLFDGGYETPEDVEKASQEELLELEGIGDKVASYGREVPGQVSLEDF